MNKKWIFFLVVLVVAGTGGYFLYEKIQNPLRTVTPRRGDVVESIYGLGTVVAEFMYRVKAGVTLELRELPVKEGDQVEKGDVLARFESSVARAPFSGTITEVAFEAGEIVPPQVTVLTLTKLDNLYLEVSLEQQSVLRIRPGQKVRVSFENLRSELSHGVVRAIYPRENQFIVKIDLEKWPEGVLPGMTADAAIEVGSIKNALLIPVNAISAGKVTRLRDGKKEKVDVKLGVVDEAWAEVVGGDLKEADSLLMRRE